MDLMGQLKIVQTFIRTSISFIQSILLLSTNVGNISYHRMNTDARGLRNPDQQQYFTTIHYNYTQLIILFILLCISICNNIDSVIDYIKSGNYIN